MPSRPPPVPLAAGPAPADTTEPLWARVVSGVFLGSISGLLILLSVSDVCVFIAALLR